MIHWKRQLQNQDQQIHFVYDIESDYRNPANIICICFAVLLTNLQKIILPGLEVVDSIHHLCSGEYFAKLIIFALEKYDHVYLWAHNGGKWDHHNVYPYLAHDSSTNVTDFTYVDFQYKRNKYIHFRDTRKFFPGPLSDLGKRVKSPKLDVHYKQCIHENLEILKPYCQQDVNILVKGFHWLQDHVIPIMAPFTSIFAFSSLPDIAWYKCCSFINVETFRFSSKLDFLTLKDCYKGGRVFSNMWGQRRQQKMQAIDVRSMYSSSLTGDLPYGEMYGPIDYFPDNYLYIALVTMFKPKQPCINGQQPLMPIRFKDGSLGYIDSGEITSWYPSVDIETLKKDGWIVKKIFQVMYWKQKSAYLRNYFMNGYKTRQTTEKGSSANLAWKLCLNAAYGKFCQFKVGSDESILNREHYIAWFCLAYSRRILYLLKQYVKGPVYYGDTDSMYIDYEEALTLQKEHPEIFKDELGDIMQNELRVDLEEPIQELIVLGKKAYGGIRETGQTFVKFKGQQDVTYEQLISVLNGRREYSKYNTCMSHYSTKGICGLAAITQKEREIAINIPEYYQKCTHCLYYYASSVFA